jgi:AraC-like DNA-binding protein
MKYIWTMKEAENWREIQRDLPAIIRLSNLPVNELCRRAGISSSHYQHILKHPERMKPKHFVAIFRAIVEAQNFENVKTKNHG